MKRVVWLALLMHNQGCALIGGGDYAVPLHLPDNDWAVGVSGAVVWDESTAIDQGKGLVGLDASWLDGVWGVHAGVRYHAERGGIQRVGGLLEATGWYGVMFGLGVRVGVAVEGLDDAPSETHPSRTAVDLTALIALPIPVWKQHDVGAIVVLPYVRPGYRITGNDKDPDDIRGFHELGVSVRWTSFSF